MSTSPLPDRAVLSVGGFCQLDRPFALHPARSLFSTFIAPLPLDHPERTLLEWLRGDDAELFSDSFLDARSAFEARLGPDFYLTSRILREWFSDPSGSLPLSGNAATLTRVFEVLGGLTVPRFCDGDHYLSFFKWSFPRLALAPGSNLATLVWLAWRYVYTFSHELNALREQLLAETDYIRGRDAVFTFVTAAGTVPNHHPLRAGDRAVSDAGVELWSYGGDGFRLFVRKHLRDLAWSLRVGLGGPYRGRAAPRWRHAEVPPFSSSPGAPLPPVDPELGDWVGVTRGNYFTYAEASQGIFVSVLGLLRCVGHTTALLRRFLCPNDPRLGMDQGPVPVETLTELRRFVSRLASPLRYVIGPPDGVGVNALDGYFVKASRLIGIPPAHWLLLEGELVDWVNHAAPLVVSGVWGVLPGEPDSLQRAGPRCVPTHCGVVFPSTVYQNAPKPTDPVGARAGSYSLSARYEELQATVARSPDPPLPGSLPRDPYVWDDPAPVKPLPLPRRR